MLDVYCECDGDRTCGFCEWVEKSMVEQANLEFDLANDEYVWDIDFGPEG